MHYISGSRRLTDGRQRRRIRLSGVRKVPIPYTILTITAECGPIVWGGTGFKVVVPPVPLGRLVLPRHWCGIQPKSESNIGQVSVLIELPDVGHDGTDQFGARVGGVAGADRADVLLWSQSWIRSGPLRARTRKGTYV